MVHVHNKRLRQDVETEPSGVDFKAMRGLVVAVPDKTVVVAAALAHLSDTRSFHRGMLL